MKKLHYQRLASVCTGYDSNGPIMGTELQDCTLEANDSNYAVQMEIAQEEAYGEVTVEEVADPEPTADEQLRADTEQALCDMDEANEAAHAEYETALCDIDEALSGGATNE